MKKRSTKELLMIKHACLRIIERNDGPVEMAKEQLAKVMKELKRRCY